MWTKCYITIYICVQVNNFVGFFWNYICKTKIIHQLNNKIRFRVKSFCKNLFEISRVLRSFPASLWRHVATQFPPLLIVSMTTELRHYSVHIKTQSWKHLWIREVKTFLHQLKVEFRTKGEGDEGSIKGLMGTFRFDLEVVYYARSTCKYSAM